MKYLAIFIVLFTISISCHKKEKKICLANLKYFVQENSFSLPRIEVNFIDKESLIKKYSENGTLEEMFFYSIPRKRRSEFLFKYFYFEKKGGDTISLSTGTNFFISDINKKWSENEIENYLVKDGIGLVIKGKDTLKITSCD
jgi:hypothetical protein